jgi:phospholipid/cholesterol/gamma-HCH transport system permease protein
VTVTEGPAGPAPDTTSYWLPAPPGRRLTNATRKAGRDSATAFTGFGRLVSLALDASTAAAVDIAARRFAWREFFEQSWFLISVSLLPTIFIAIPFGLVLVLEVGGLATQIGASSVVGAVDSIGIVREAAPIISGILLAGAGGSAICADLGARTIRDEIAAMEVMSIDPVARLVAPRLLATVAVAMLLNGVVAFAGIMSGYFAAVEILHSSAGGFLESFSAFSQAPDVVESMLKAAVFGAIAAVVASYQGMGAKRGPAGVGEAVNRSVVITGVALFVANLVLTEIFLVTVPPVVL